ncbi:MAG: hypothetical protein IPI14_11340 [Polaromonas sp.]|nr:hypothetical protein [Polaromonas sp.]
MSEGPFFGIFSTAKGRTGRATYPVEGLNTLSANLESMTPMMLAVQVRDEKLMDWLMKNEKTSPKLNHNVIDKTQVLSDADPIFTAFDVGDIAVRENQVDIYLKLVSYGLEVDKKDLLVAMLGTSSRSLISPEMVEAISGAYENQTGNSVTSLIEPEMVDFILSELSKAVEKYDAEGGKTAEWAAGVLRERIEVIERIFISRSEK